MKSLCGVIISTLFVLTLTSSSNIEDTITEEEIRRVLGIDNGPGEIKLIFV